MQKTTEKISAVETHVEMTNGGDATMPAQPEETNNANTQNGEQQNLQMDVSMSG